MPKERVVFGRPIGQNQGIQFPIARAYANMRAAVSWCTRRSAVTRRDEPAARGQHGEDAGGGCLFEAANVAIQTHGGFGFAEEYDIERKFRETRLYQVAPISTNLILSYLAEHVLGLPRSY